jgi:putative flippase GtrA
MKLKLFDAVFRILEGIGGFGRYVLTGGVLFLLDLAVFLALVQLVGWEPALAQPVGRATGAVAGFFGHRYVTFFHNRNNPRHGIAAQGGGYLVVGAAMLAITPFILLLFLRVNGGELVSAKVLTEIVAVILVYLCLRIVFAAKGSE